MSVNNITKEEFDEEMMDLEQQFGNVISNKQSNTFKGKLKENHKKQQKKFKKDKYL